MAYSAAGKPGSTFSDGTISAVFRKTPDADVAVGLVGRLQDLKNFYAVRVKGEDQIELVRSEGWPGRGARQMGDPQPPDSETTSGRFRSPLTDRALPAG